MVATQSQDTTPPAVMDDVLARHFTAEAAHDRPGILATLTENAEHEPVGFPGAPFHGHDELMGFYEVLFEEIEQLDVQPVRRLHGPNLLIDEVQYRGRVADRLAPITRALSRGALDEVAKNDSVESLYGASIWPPRRHSPMSWAA